MLQLSNEGATLIRTKTLNHEEILKAVIGFLSDHIADIVGNDEFEGDITCAWNDDSDNEREIDIYIIDKEDPPPSDELN